MDITMVVGLDITEDIVDGEDTMDTPTEDMDTVYWENAPLMLNPKLMPNPRPRPLPGTDTMVDIMDIPTDTDTTDIPTDVTIGRFLSLSQILAVLSKLANFYPPFELSTNQQLLPSKILKFPFFFKKHFVTNIFIWTKEFFLFFEKGSVQSNIIGTALHL